MTSHLPFTVLLISRGLTGLLVGSNYGISNLYWVEVASSPAVKKRVCTELRSSATLLTYSHSAVNIAMTRLLYVDFIEDLIV